MHHPKYNARPENTILLLIVNVTSRCNRNCVNCCGEYVKQDKDLSFDKLKEIIDACIVQGNIKLFYPSCTGETTLYPHCTDIVRYLNSINKRDLLVRQDTNAGFIPDGFIEAINDAGYYYDLSVSLWAGDAVSYRELQGGDFDATVANVRRYLKEIKHPMSFSAPYMNEEQFSGAERLIRSLCNEVGRELVVTENGNEDLLHGYHLDGKCTLYQRKYLTPAGLTSNHGTHFPLSFGNNCDSLYKSLIITHEGDILPCIRFAQKKTYKLGSVFDYQPLKWSDIVAIYNSDKAKEYWHNNFSAGNVAFKECRSCLSRVCY